MLEASRFTGVKCQETDGSDRMCSGRHRHTNNIRYHLSIATFPEKDLQGYREILGCLYDEGDAHIPPLSPNRLSPIGATFLFSAGKNKSLDVRRDVPRGFRSNHLTPRASGAAQSRRPQNSTGGAWCASACRRNFRHALGCHALRLSEVGCVQRSHLSSLLSRHHLQPAAVLTSFASSLNIFISASEKFQTSQPSSNGY